jgi:hypothetical protein
MSFEERNLIDAQRKLLDVREATINTLESKISVMETVIAAQRENIKLTQGIRDRLQETVSELEKREFNSLPPQAVNFLLYWQRYMETDCRLSPREAHNYVVRSANEVLALDGKTPDGRFSDAQCVFWSLLPQEVREAGLFLSTDPN